MYILSPSVRELMYCLPKFPGPKRDIWHTDIHAGHTCKVCLTYPNIDKSYGWGELDVNTTSMGHDKIEDWKKKGEIDQLRTRYTERRQLTSSLIVWMMVPTDIKGGGRDCHLTHLTLFCSLSGPSAQPAQKVLKGSWKEFKRHYLVKSMYWDILFSRRSISLCRYIRPPVSWPFF